MDRNDDEFVVAPEVNRVATREGGVDRNWLFRNFFNQRNTSPPARVAWIET